jgi:hypothetical protein
MFAGMLTVVIRKEDADQGQDVAIKVLNGYFWKGKECKEPAWLLKC